MSSSPEKSLPINPITGQQLGKPSQDYDYNKTIRSFNHNNPEKSNFKINHHTITQEELQKKVDQFLNSKINQKPQYDEYHDQFCVCVDCTYERNLNKPSHSLFNLTMRSIYKQSYSNSFNKNQKANCSPKVSKQFNDNFIGKSTNQKQSSIHPKNKVSLETIYNVEMNKGNNAKKMKSLKSDDLLKFQGPISNTTTYKQKFPGVSGANPYVKPLDKAVRQSFRLNSKTINSTVYTGQFTERSPLAKSPDNIRTGLPMISKQSTSQRFYTKPLNPEHYSRTLMIKSLPKRVESPYDRHQYESIYRNSFYQTDILEAVKHKKRLIRDTMSKLGISN